LTHTIFIDGEAGTTGLEIRERLKGRGELEFISLDEGERKNPDSRKEALNTADLVILCLPDEAAKAAVSMIDNPHVRVIDASTAFRISNGWTYGFPELRPGQREAIANSRRVSNPGCYPTGFLALVSPLVRAGIIPGFLPITINAVSGYSGGGKSMIAEFEGTGADQAPAYRAYGLSLRHKHVPEMTRHAGLNRDVLFSPAVGAYRQGMIVEVPLQLSSLPSRTSIEVIHGALDEAYDGEHFVKVISLEESEAMTGLAPEGLNGTNVMNLHVFGDREGEQVRLVALLDNLGKGASGAAVQNLNLMLGLYEASGLD
jgi:N-acetyl-gamma-glutamyl-phosphate reductase